MGGGRRATARPPRPPRPLPPPPSLPVGGQAPSSQFTVLKMTGLNLGRQSILDARSNASKADCSTGNPERLQLKLVKEICNVQHLSAPAAGAVIMSIKMERNCTTDNDIVDGVTICKSGTSGPIEIDCSFRTVGFESSARSIFNCAVSVPHKRIAKAYFCAFSESLGRYFICYERIKRFGAFRGQEELIGDPSNQNQPGGRWLSTIRETFVGLDQLHKQNYGHEGTDFVYAQEGGSYEFVKMIGATSLNLSTDADLKKSKCNQRMRYLELLENYGAGSLLEFESFKELVFMESRVEIILNHPFLLETPKERVLSVVDINETMFGFDRDKIRTLENDANSLFPNLIWKDIVLKNYSIFGLYDLNAYDDDFKGFTRFLRNYVEHLGGQSPYQQVNYRQVNTTLSNLFPGLIGWLYTLSHTVKDVTS